MEPIVRTIYGAYLQTCHLLKLPVTIKANSTLNEKFNIHKDVAIADTDMPAVKYLAIGNGGHKMTVGADNIAVPVAVPHLPRHAGLYNQLPFVMRLPDNDLVVGEREKYRLRRLEVHDGITYVAYYLKVLDLSTTTPQLELRTVTDGIVVSTPLTPTLEDLNPTPPAITPNSVLTTTGDYAAATAKVPFVMTSDDIDEFLNVCNIIYGSDNQAIISEMAMCSGLDKSLVGDFNGVSIGYTDAIAVQVTSYISSFYAVKFNRQQVGISFDLGSLEPMLTLTNS